MNPSCAPRVAAIVPVYCARFLAECLESVFFQSRPPDEVIVVDDGSPDRGELARALTAYPDKVRLLRQANQGAGAARNLALRATSAELVAFLDADDRWLPDFLREQLSVFEQRPWLDVSYTNGMLIGGTPLAGRALMDTNPSRGEVTLETLLSQECRVLLSATVARRSAVVHAGLFDPDLRRGQDFDLWLRMARSGARFTYQRQILMLRRIHEQNLSGSQSDQMQRALRVFTKTLATMPLTSAERAAAERRVRELNAGVALERGKQLLREGKLAEAYAALMQACGAQAGWKLRAALIGLRLVPGLVRRLYVGRAEASPAS